MAIRLYVLDILRERGVGAHYPIYRAMGMSWQNFDRITRQQASAIHLETIDKFCTVLKVTPGELLERVPDEHDR